MKKMLIALLFCMPMLASAQDSYDAGSFWGVASVDTKDGQFDAYMDNLSSLWQKQMEMMQKAGKVKSYKIFSNVHARVGEPDLWLFVEWTSAGAMMDTTNEEWEAMTEELMGSMEKSRDLSMKRGELRTLMSDILLRELTFK
ncbi:hypothetical protein [Congregibacter sp.]|uniref:hypothetical protein n=1 Tax=Congregibacter sp. TaxID=2744308 RepID=UPI003F6A65A7